MIVYSIILCTIFITYIPIFLIFLSIVTVHKELKKVKSLYKKIKLHFIAYFVSSGLVTILLKLTLI